jgi:hypothetical protein
MKIDINATPIIVDEKIVGIETQNPFRPEELIRHYYKKLDRVIIENMPLDILLDFHALCSEELKRREIK